MPPPKRKIPPIILFLACAKLAIELPYVSAYGYFRDELYYLACARRLAWGYVDHPPLSIAVLAVMRSIGGEGLLSIRLVPAFAGAVVIALTAALTKRMGGGALAQGLAALAVLCAPEYLASSHFYSMNALDVLFWTLAATYAARAVEESPDAPVTRARGDEGIGARTAWILLGVTLGLGLENKLSVLFCMAGLAVGVVVTPARAWCKTRWPWIAAAIALGLLLPYVAWERANDWPTREFMRNAVRDKMAPVSPFEFFVGQLEGMSPFSAPLWMLGLGALLVSKRLARFRALGVSFVVVAGILLVNGKSRAGYLAPAYPPLFAAGAAFADAWLGARVWRYAAAAGLMTAGAAVLVPFAVPVFPVYQFMRYAARLGQEPRSEERKAMGALPQYYADMFGWRELTENVALVYGALTDDERRVAAIYAGNYGEAGAIEMFGKADFLPTPISGHNDYWLWGPRGADGQVVIVVGDDPAFWRARCERFEVAAVVSHSLVMPYEDQLPISICRKTKRPLDQTWDEYRHYE